MPSFTRIIIDPGHGHCDAYGNFDPGHQIMNLHEVTLIDDVVADMSDILLHEGLPFDVLQTRKKPGIPPAERPRAGAREIQIAIHFGWAKTVARNGGTVYVAGPKDHALGQIIGDTLDKWGTQTCASYAGVRIVQANAPNLPIYSEEAGTLGLQVEPFCLNAIDAIVYSARLRQLGASLGQVLAAYLRGQNAALGSRRTQVWGNGPDGREVFGG